jgi:hypothetical protein
MPDVGRQAIAGPSGFPWVIAGLCVAAVGTLVAAIAVGLRRHHADPSTVNVLDVVGATVGILGGLAALAGQFYGVGHRDRPPPHASAVVREVYARIPRDEYLQAMGQERVGAEDGRELGNVIWLQLDFVGYAEQKTMRLSYASYGAAAGAGELPKTAVDQMLTLLNSDHQQAFLPLWVGLPKVKFQVQVRLVEPHTGAVRAMTSTNAMSGAQRRYACTQS